MTTLVLSILNLYSLLLQIRRKTIRACMILNFVEIPSPIGSSLFLRVTRATIKAWMGSKLGQIRPWTVE